MRSALWILYPLVRIGVPRGFRPYESTTSTIRFRVLDSAFSTSPPRLSTASNALAGRDRLVPHLTHRASETENRAYDEMRETR